MIYEPQMLNFMKMPVILILLCLLVGGVSAADFEKSNLRAQVYLGATPYYPTNFYPNGRNVLRDQIVVPVQAGVLWSPLFTPAFKLDIPLTFWLGFEVGNVEFATLYDASNINDGDTTLPTNNHESLSWSQWMPSITSGLSYNLFGNFDLRVLGGFGWTRTSFTHELSQHPKVLSAASTNYFASANLEYVLSNDFFQGTDLKLAAFVRKDFQDVKNVLAVSPVTDPLQIQTLDDVTFSKIEQTNLKIGLEVSLDFGRESRADRKVRFQLRDRDSELRNHNKGMDTLNEWDCMAIERDYKFFIAPNGDIPDMHEKFTKSQFTDVLESFLAFCTPEDLHTKERLYASLDTNKVQLKQYQITQEETRYRQVMASNDVSYLKMYLQYYPNSRYRSAVESKMKVLDDYSAFRAARSANTFKEYLQYMAAFPEGHYLGEAETGIFVLVQAANRQKDYEIYLKKFPEGKYVNEARRALSDMMKSQ